MKRILILILFGFFFFLFGNHHFTLFDNSETNYSCVAKEIVHTGDALTMHYNGQPWFVHPPLYFWLSSSLCRLLGWTEFNLRFWEGLFGILGLIVTFLIGRLFFAPNTAMLGAMILGSSLYYSIISRLAIFDTLLNVFVLLQVLFFWKAYRNPPHTDRYFLAYAFSAALAVLTKGPFGLLHAGMVIVLFLLLKKNLKFLIKRSIFGCFLLMLLLISPWYGYELFHHGWAFFNVALKDYTWFRFFGVVENQTGPWFYYFPVMLLFFPWIFFLPGTLVSSWKQYRLKNLSDFSLFSWLFILVTFLFFSFAGTKLPNYIFSVFPFLSLLMAASLLDNQTPKLLITETVFLALFSLSLVLITIYIPLSAPYVMDRSLIIFSCSILWGVSLPALFFGVIGRPSQLIGTLVGGMLVWLLFMVHVFFPVIEKYKESKDFVALIARPTPYTLINYQGYSPYLMYYLNHPVVHAQNLSEISLHPTQDTFIIVPNSDPKAVGWLDSHAKLLKKCIERSLYYIDSLR